MRRVLSIRRHVDAMPHIVLKDRRGRLGDCKLLKLQLIYMESNTDFFQIIHQEYTQVPTRSNRSPMVRQRGTNQYYTRHAIGVRLALRGLQHAIHNGLPAGTDKKLTVSEKKT